MAEAIPFLEVKNITKLFAGEKTSGVKNIDLSIAEGKIMAIIGQSGSGKSTLLNLIYGLIAADEGKIYLEGERVWGPDVKLIPGHEQMKMVTQQSDHLNLYAKVWDNVSSLLPNTNLEYKSAKTTEVLQQLRLLDLKNRRVADLSGGERQRVSIARALVSGPKVLLLDEPFNQVDASFRDNLQQDIRKIVFQTGLTVIMVSHDPQEVLSLADELVVLKDGEIVETGKPRNIYNNPRSLYSAQLLSNCNILTKAQALTCGITADASTVVIYPEWISVEKNFGTKKHVVKEVWFKGTYEELLVACDDVDLRVFQFKINEFKAGEFVSLNFMKFLAFGA
ncbi:ABC transporter ATP-binding protein [Mucilaginibacter sp.]|uniref:ABC transporter ATP-binding protein n=1 Tax=Mucilaginibacter sp. TaxID=1882438 RepID=UPI003B0004FE